MKAVYIVLGVLLMCIGSFFYGDHVGSNAQLVKTQKEALDTANGKVTALIDAAAQVKATVLADQAKSRKATADYETALTALQQKYDVLIAQRKSAGGLRDPGAICHPVASGTQTTGTSRPDGASTGSVELSAGVTEHLYALTRRADELAEQLRGLQAWVKANGFYGDPETKVSMDKVELDLRTVRATIDAQVIELMEDGHDS